jgi:branched-chain amino acid transport system ATP-binding protein
MSEMASDVLADLIGEPLLDVRHLEVSYGSGVALSGVSLSVLPGEAVAVLGANGAGKSTLARACCGLVPSRAGRINWDGKDVTNWSADRRRRAGIMYLPEGRGIFPDLTVYENMCIAACLLRSRSARQEAIDRAAVMFPVLGQRAKQLAGSLSGGEQQMLSLARATVVVPRLIIADELSLGLAPLIVDQVLEYLARIRSEEGVAVVLIEQFVHRALAFADRCVILRRGTVSWTGKSTEGAGEAMSAYIGATDQ